MDQELTDHLIQFYGRAFADAFLRTMDFEGGWSNHPSDRGGKTKFGVTQATLDHHNRQRDDKLSLRALTIKQAADVYYHEFWLAMRINTLPHTVQGLMFDWGVHSGFFAIRSMQRHFKLKPDGVVGPRTRAAVAAQTKFGDTSRALLRALAVRRMKHLCRLVRRDRKQGDFIVGWFDRVSYWLY